MVNEVEFSNFLEILDPNQPYSDKIGNPLLKGALRDSGTTLSVTVKKAIPQVGARQLSLYFGNVDFESKLVDYVLIGESELDDFTLGPPDEATNRKYVFDLGKVLEIPRKVYSTRGTSEITIELYTYEANLTTDYGSKRLSVPYTISSETQYNYDNSTDGVYRLYTVEYAIWDSATEYEIGDIIYVPGNGLFVSLTDNNISNLPATNPTFWGEPSDEDKLDFAYGTTKNQPINTVLSDGLITRYAKYEYIFKTIKEMGYKKFNDNSAAEKAMLLHLFREQALVHLTNNKPISAAETLQQLKLAYGSMTENTEIRSYNINYTL